MNSINDKNFIENNNKPFTKLDMKLPTTYNNEPHPFEEITDKMFETYLRKNEDYGNSFDQSLDKWGLSVAAIRLGDKLNRFESFVKNKSFEVKDESVRDTLMDLGCYSIMTIMYLDNKK